MRMINRNIEYIDIFISIVSRFKNTLGFYTFLIFRYSTHKLEARYQIIYFQIQGHWRLSKVLLSTSSLSTPDLRCPIHIRTHAQARSS